MDKEIKQAIEYFDGYGSPYDELVIGLLRKQLSMRNKSIDNTEIHMEICKELNELYRVKNHDYGDSFGETFDKLGIISAVTRITDKVNRLQSLCTKEQLVNDEKIEDTLMDAANYCIMTLIELRKED